MNAFPQRQVFPTDISALSGGSGSLVVLLPGWPETADAYGDVFPTLAAKHKVLVLDPPGLGDSAPSAEGYDTAQTARTLANAVEGAIDGPYHLVGHELLRFFERVEGAGS